ncbi:MAG: AAA family ATPase [Deltaproteobacteria bacterium]|nr:AAA family ATPase [Deltaproteobacteria bacterium]MBW1962236.1 AAA family ATPase [Deltaproteobacteria bacterium]MBW2153719.1 AAA family ATPase [Deltaproteobacteria bacterium]
MELRFAHPFGDSTGRANLKLDTLPGDILGVSVFEQKSGSFIFHQEPIFALALCLFSASIPWDFSVDGTLQ